MNTPPPPSSDEIVEAVRASGWLLEQDTETALREAGYRTTPGKAYQDPDDPAVSREIDVHGYQELFRDDERRLSVGVRVIAECKHSSSPYVLIGKPADTRQQARIPTEHRLRYPEISASGQASDGTTISRTKYAWYWHGLHELPGSPNLDPFIATQMTRLERKKTWTADNAGIFTALIYPLAKALRAIQDQYATPRSRDHDRRHDWASIELVYPVVVTTAQLFALDASAEPLRPQPVAWATAEREIKTKAIRGTFYVDFVQYEALEEYLRARVQIFCDGVAERVRADPERFLVHTVTPDELGWEA